MVHRSCGTIKWLVTADETARSSFYRKAETMSSSELAALCKRDVSISRNNFQGWHENGLFKPLTVWAKEVPLGWLMGIVIWLDALGKCFSVSVYMFGFW